MTKINGEYILLVDDEKDILFLYNIWLNSYGYQTVSFDNPIEALKYLDKNNNLSSCYLVITDYKMPQLSGIDLIKKIRERDMNCKIKIMLISAYLKNDILKDNPYLGKIDKILEKPLTLDTLKMGISDLID
jgi:CheY-like chemotaxis protein